MYTLKPEYSQKASYLSPLFKWGIWIGGLILALAFEGTMKPVYAYIGPGLGLGSVMVVVGLGLSILLAIRKNTIFPVFGRIPSSSWGRLALDSKWFKSIKKCPS